MIKKRIKKIFRLTFLIAIRQLWKLLCNLYHMIEEPFWTFKKLIIKDHDKSQMFLMGIVFLAPILGYSIARIFWDYYRFGTIINGVGIFFMMAVVMQFFLLGYLIYWICRISKNK